MQAWGGGPSLWMANLGSRKCLTKGSHLCVLCDWLTYFILFICCLSAYQQLSRGTLMGSSTQHPLRDLIAQSYQSGAQRGSGAKMYRARVAARGFLGGSEHLSEPPLFCFPAWRMGSSMGSSGEGQAHPSALVLPSALPSPHLLPSLTLPTASACCCLPAHQWTLGSYLQWGSMPVLPASAPFSPVATNVFYDTLAAPRASSKDPYSPVLARQWRTFYVIVRLVQESVCKMWPPLQDGLPASAPPTSCFGTGRGRQRKCGRKRHSSPQLSSSSLPFSFSNPGSQRRSQVGG